jgi:uncharacterized membrane protein YfcA
MESSIEWAIPAVGLVAGFRNVLADGGSMLTLPGLMMAGLDPVTANATSRLAILVQNLVGTASFHRIEPYGTGVSTRRALLTVPAAIAGAALAAHAPPQVITATLCLALVWGGLHLVTGGGGRRKRGAAPEGGDEGEVRARSALPWMLLIGFYGGFVQAGVGFLFVAVLCGRLGMSTLAATREKVLAVLLYTTPAFVLFAWKGQVDWRAGALLAVGQAAGALIATRLGSRAGDVWIRRVLGFALVAVAVRLVAGWLLG